MREALELNGDKFADQLVLLYVADEGTASSRGVGSGAALVRIVGIYHTRQPSKPNPA